MKSREQKQKDLNALTEELNNSKSAMVVGFDKVTVAKDQEFRNQLREAGAKFQVVKNTIARLAVKDSAYSEIEGNFQGMNAIAWTDADPVVLSKAVSKFIKDNKDFYSFRTGIVEGKVDTLIFFIDPLSAHPHDVDVKALVRVAVLSNIVFALNRTTADSVLSNLLPEAGR